MLRQSAPEIAFRSEVSGRGKAIQRKVAPFGAFQRIVPPVVNKSEAGAAYSGGKGQQRNFAEIIREMTGLHQAKIIAVGYRVRARPGPRLGAGFSKLLPQVDLSLKSLRRERSHIQTVVVKSCVDQLELIVVE